MKLDPQKTIYVIDGSSFLYRAYYGMRPLHTKSGVPVQAVYSFCRMIKKMIDAFSPQHMIIVWDAPGKTTRHDMFDDYKATRDAPPSDLFEQKEYITRFCDLIGLPQITKPGIEADDIMYSLAKEQEKLGNTSVFVTSDKDMAQALSDHIVLYDPFKERLVDVAAFETEKEIPVSKIPFYFSMLGDTSDNIPGVRGIGKKGAFDLVNQFDSLEDMYARIDEIKKERTKNALRENKQNAFLSRDLFLLQYHPTHLDMNELIFDGSQWVKARPFFAELDFKSMLKEVDADKSVQNSQKEAVIAHLSQYNFVTVTTQEELDDVVEKIKEKKCFAFDTETDGFKKPLQTQCVGISCCMQEGTAYYIPFGHHVDQKQLSKDQVIESLKPLFQDPSIAKITHSANFDVQVMHGLGVEVKGVSFDTIIAANLIVKDWERKNLKFLSENFLGDPMLTYAQVVKDNKYKDFSYVPLELATLYSAADAHQTFKLKAYLEEALEKEQLTQLYDSIEFPLVEVLLAMEIEGIYLDTQQLFVLGKKVEQELATILERIKAAVGPDYQTINLNSPRQVEQLLFVELGLPPQKKSAKKTGYSTDQEVLEILATMHEVPALISKWRELSKLKNTYIDALPGYVNPNTHKIHTIFDQISTSTGRLASSDPNMQNIPTDGTGYGIEIRAAFCPDAGHVFLSADYSQIELRVLAYLSQDENLRKAFDEGLDIHSQTASKLFDIPLDTVTHEQRQIGKRINFSILYGLTPYGLSKDLNISFKDAKNYIDKYFAQYPGVKKWMESIIEQTKEKGYVTTLYGRRRYIPAIYERNRVLYDEACRLAINTAAQGTAAEVMKRGMNVVYKLLKKQAPQSRMLLQIHDELLISVPADQANAVETITKNALEMIVDWNVPLEVTTRLGSNWKEVSK